MGGGVNFIGMITRCEDCDHALLGDEVEHLYKGKSYCDDCYKVVKATEIGITNRIQQIRMVVVVKLFNNEQW